MVFTHVLDHVVLRFGRIDVAGGEEVCLLVHSPPLCIEWKGEEELNVIDWLLWEACTHFDRDLV